MEIFDTVVQRPVFITLAIAGAVLATVGNVMMNRQPDSPSAAGKFTLRLGYALACCSVVIFIAAGFRG